MRCPFVIWLDSSVKICRCGCEFMALSGNKGRATWATISCPNNNKTAIKYGF